METKSSSENTSTTSKQTLARRIAIAGCAAVVALGLGTVFYINATSATAPSAQEQHAEKSVSVSIKPKGAEDMTKDSTPLIVHLKGADEDTREVDTYHAITAQEIKDNKAQVEVVPGKYEISWITPINKDGSLYEVPAKKTVVLAGEDKQTWLAKSDAQDLATTQAVTDAATAKDNQQKTTDAATDAASTQASTDAATTLAASTGTKDTTSFEGNEVSPELKKVDADKVSDKQKEEALKAIEEATKKGDETLSGDAGKKVVETAKENTLQQPSEKKKDGSKPEEAKQEEKKDEQKPEDKSESTKTETKDQTSSNTKAEKPASSQGNMNNSDKGNSKPKGHYETVPVYETRPVYKTVPVYETKPVYDTVEYWVTSDGHRFNSEAALEAYAEDMAVNHGIILSDSLETEYVQVGTKQVQVGTKQVQTGTQQVQVGTKQVWVAD